MAMDTDVTPAVGGDGATTEPTPQPVRSPEDEVRERLWWMSRALYRYRWFLVLLTLIGAVGSVALALWIPVEYRAETRVMLPEGGSGMAGLIESVVPGASALLGGGGGEYTRYLAILDSRTMMEETVNRFDLVRDYETSDGVDPEADAVDQLRQNLTLAVNLEFNYLSVEVYDRDPEQAAQIANFLVERLNERNIALSSSNAAQNRELLETRLSEAKADLDSARAELQAFQEQSGLIQVEAQSEALMRSLADARGIVAEAEVRYQALLEQYGPENPDVSAAAAAVSAARRQIQELSGGGDSMLPVAMGRLPIVQRRYAEVMQDVLIQQAIVEQVQPLYEQAALQERQSGDAVQVLDPAVVPAKKARPQRSTLVIALTASVFLLGLLFVLVSTWLREYGPLLAARVRG